MRPDGVFAGRRCGLVPSECSRPVVCGPAALVQRTPDLSGTGLRLWRRPRVSGPGPDRAEFADPALFPQADAVYQADYEALPADLGVTQDDYVCIMTRGHVGDYDVQRQMLAIKPYYLGVIGSRRKLAFVKEKLLADGFSAAEIDACHAPIGLAISAVTPAEIAISIAAELIAVRVKREGREKSRYRKP